jgi:non-heme chloroperoxidase
MTGRWCEARPEDLLKVRLGDTVLHYVQSGLGEPVVLVHGGLADYRLWGNLSGRLSERFRVVAYSRRGSYPNEPTKGPTNVLLHSSDLASFISYVSETPVHLVGESYGALVAIHCAIHNPGSVMSLTVDEPPILSLLSDEAYDKAELQRFETEALKPALDNYEARRPEDAARVLIGYLDGSSKLYDHLPAEVRKSILANSDATYADLRGGLGGVSREDVRLMKPHTLLMKSEFGPSLLKHLVDILYELTPHRLLKEVKGASHGTIVDSQDYITSVVRFLSGELI